MELKFIVLKNTIYQTKKDPCPVCNNGDYVALFTFDKNWNGLSKTARFSCYGKNKEPIEMFDVPIIDGKCNIPPITVAGKVTVGVYGGDIKTTNVTTLIFVESALTNSAPQGRPIESIYNKIMLMFEKYYIRSAKLKENGELVFERGDGTEISAGSTDGVTVVGEKVQADWTELDDSAPSFVKNKPSIENEVKKDSENPVSSFAIYDELSKKLNSPKGEGLDGQALFYRADGPHWSDIPHDEPSVDDAIDETSENPVQNKVLAEELKRKTNVGHKHSLEDVGGLQESLSNKAYASHEHSYDNIVGLNDHIVAELSKRDQIKPEFADTLEECTDVGKLYVLPDGYIYANMLSKVDGGIYPFGANSFGEMTTPYGSTKSAYSFMRNGSSVEGRLNSLTFSCLTGSVDVVFAIAHMNNGVIESIDEIPLTTKYGENTYLNGVKFNYTGTIKVGDLIGFRMDTAFKLTYGTVSDQANACITTTSLSDHTYTHKTYGFAISANVQEVTEAEIWKNTGHRFVPQNENTTMTSFSLSNPAVRSFERTADYNDADYSYTNVSSYVSDEGYRKDIPLPVYIGWTRGSNAVEYSVAIDGKTLTTSDNKIALYNLMPNKSYSYTVQELCADATKRTIKEGVITTENGVRMLNVDGIQNVRDIGGYATSNGIVKYGKIIRGSAIDEAAFERRQITEKGRDSLVTDLKVRTEIDLRGNSNTVALGKGISFKSIPYQAYSSAITSPTQRGYFKTMLEYIVECLKNDQAIYVHCSGGCDRTGTLVFLLLGLLGVSESDLAKEYELSSFSPIGKFRTRNSNEYDYKGLVTTVKAYSGQTLKEKLISFAYDCGVSNATINSFESLMIG